MNNAMRTVLGVLVASLLLMCGPSGMENLGDAMVDVGTTIRDGAADATSDAEAQTTCGTCTADSLRVTTAETDFDQQIQGFADDDGELVAGPAIVTDVRAYGGGGYLYLTQVACSDVAYDAADLLISMAPSEDVMGARFIVPVGMRLCVYDMPGSMSWSGYRPYQ